MKTVLITGASGLLGRPLVRAFQAASWSVTGLAHSRASGELLSVDLTDAKLTEKIVTEKRPNVIVHSAAQRFPDKVEKDYDGSYALNVTASKNLAALADAVGAAFIFISTDYVFDGRDPPYSESAKPNPLNKYGKTKAEAERAVLSAKPDAVVLRVPVLYGGEEYVAESSVSVLCELLNDRSKHVKASDYEIRYPSHTEDIAFIVVQLAERGRKDRSVSGVYQWCGLEPLTKYAMVRAIGQAHGLSTDHVSPDAEPSSGAPRPRDCRLEHSRLQQLGIARHTPFAQGVAGFAKFLRPAAGQHHA
ncbi:methionine adenosyltransferase 2 subunit beta-like isoform X2 [Dermacentor andersoni]|nr:methionine adenosyltransferase 2 subunit beta-like isoform X2 [Dermacentor andersoni]